MQLYFICLNKYISYLIGNTYHGLKIADSCYPFLNEKNIHLVTLFVLLYADDTVVLAENEHQL